MNNKGLNFIVGVGGLWLLWKLWSSGILASIGFMTVGAAFNQDLMYCMQDGTVYTDTPLAAFAALFIDAIAVFGSLLIMVSTGLWDLLMSGGGFLSDLAVKLKSYLESYLPEEEKVEDTKEDSSKSEEVSLSSIIKSILVSIKEMQSKQESIEEKLKEKVEVTEIVKEKEVE